MNSLDFNDFLTNQIINSEEILDKLDMQKSYSQERNNLLIACIILTYNEERCIERCINSVIDVFDEIIIIDTGSADNTLSKILNLNYQKVTIYNYKWKNDFSKARNFGINKANSKWVAFIDADEEMGNEYKENFRQLISFLDCSNNKKTLC